MNFFYIITNDLQQGPFSLDELKEKSIQKDTLVWTEGMKEWQQAVNIEELAEMFRAVPPPVKVIEQEKKKEKIYYEDTGSKIYITSNNFTINGTTYSLERMFDFRVGSTTGRKIRSLIWTIVYAILFIMSFSLGIKELYVKIGIWILLGMCAVFSGTNALEPTFYSVHFFNNGKKHKEIVSVNDKEKAQAVVHALTKAIRENQ
jgi:hypothetical protein